ncbi:MAG: cytochrome c biogenesis CcdA family protein [Acidimicrobiales bacterium]
MSLLLGGSIAAAFAAGMVAFFAPCCAGVMLPAYLAAIGGGHRVRVARLTALYVAGVASAVLPITIGAAALASYVSRWHPQLFTLGGLMMLGVAVALWRGTMLPVSVPQPRLSGSMLSVSGLGLFSGAATACCAPVLAGAIALSATSGTIAGGLLLGVAYVTGMTEPLVPLALVYGHTRRTVRDPKVTLRLGSQAKPIDAVRLAGVLIFAGFSLLFIALALTTTHWSADKLALPMRTSAITYVSVPLTLASARLRPKVCIGKFASVRLAPNQMMNWAFWMSGLSIAVVGSSASSVATWWFRSQIATCGIVLTVPYATPKRSMKLSSPSSARPQNITRPFPVALPSRR